MQLIFQLTQHYRDEQLMKSLKKLLDCGNIYRVRDVFQFKVTNIDDILKKIIPFLKKHPVLGVKALEFAD